MVPTIFRYFAAILLLLTAIISDLSAGDQVYQYATADGVPLFTDKKHRDFELLSSRYYGRPPAYTSCRLQGEKLQQRLSEYGAHIRAMASKYEIDARLIKAVIATESCFNPKAVSRVGAQGLMQLMPATAKQLGVSDPFDPEQNITGGVKYLRMMMDRFGQNQQLALAAYNAGPEAVVKYKNQIPPYKETQRYVKKIMRLIEG